MLGSYVLGFAAWPDAVSTLWGGVPQALRPLYTAWMFVAAAGYLLFTSVFFFRTEPARMRHSGGRGWDALLVPYALVLVGSALWLPATKLHLDGALLFVFVWLDLLGVAAGSLGLLVAVATLTPRPRGVLHTLASVGAVAFCIQTVLLDAVVWPLLFPRG